MHMHPLPGDGCPAISHAQPMFISKISSTPEYLCRIGGHAVVCEMQLKTADGDNQQDKGATPHLPLSPTS
eukprot:scaffold59803_cov14-Tisochrysis_lutea.AAC.2